MESEHVKPVDTPCKSGPPLSKKDAVKYERGEDHPWPFRSLLGSIMYACITRCDIQYAVSVLAKLCSCPDVKAWNAARRVLRFLRATSTRTLKMGGYNPILFAWADADWCGDPDEYRSTSGIIIFLSWGPLVFSSRLQRATALSITESEFRASALAVLGEDLPAEERAQLQDLENRQKVYSKTLSACQSICSLLGLRTMLKELGFPQPPTYLFTDSRGNLMSIKNPITTKLRHVNMRWHKIRQCVDNGDIVVCDVRTNNMLADLLTKRHKAVDHERLSALCMGHKEIEGLPADLQKLLATKVPLPTKGGLDDLASGRCPSCGASLEKHA